MPEKNTQLKATQVKVPLATFRKLKMIAASRPQTLQSLVSDVLTEYAAKTKVEK